MSNSEPPSLPLNDLRFSDGTKKAFKEVVNALHASMQQKSDSDDNSDDNQERDELQEKVGEKVADYLLCVADDYRASEKERGVKQIVDPKGVAEAVGGPKVDWAKKVIAKKNGYSSGQSSGIS